MLLPLNSTEQSGLGVALPLGLLKKKPNLVSSVLTHSFSTRRDVFFQRPPAACILLQDGIGFGGPFEGLKGFGLVLRSTSQVSMAD